MDDLAKRALEEAYSIGPKHAADAVRTSFERGLIAPVERDGQIGWQLTPSGYQAARDLKRHTQH